jgi:hypothetical protein
MSPSPVSRREFIASGSVLAAGSVVPGCAEILTAFTVTTISDAI